MTSKPPCPSDTLRPYTIDDIILIPMTEIPSYFGVNKFPKSKSFRGISSLYGLERIIPIIRREADTSHIFLMHTTKDHFNRVLCHPRKKSEEITPKIFREPK